MEQLIKLLYEQKQLWDRLVELEEDDTIPYEEVESIFEQIDSLYAEMWLIAECISTETGVWPAQILEEAERMAYHGS